MLSFNRKFGLGAALRQRSIWSGSARSVNGLVTTQLNPYKPRSLTSPANLLLEGVSNNGSVYVGMASNLFYTSPDMATFTQRTVSGTNNAGISAAGTRVAALTFNSGSNAHFLYVSSDNGATFGGGTNVGISGSGNGSLRAAGGIAFSLSANATATVYGCDSTGAIGARTMPDSRVWNSVASTGAAWVMISAAGTAAYSANGTSWTTSASYAAEAVKLPALPSQVYGLGSRLIAVAVSSASLSTIYSDDGGVTWQQGAAYGVFLEGRNFTGLSAFHAVLDGHLYVSTVSGGKGQIVSTHNGIAWRSHIDINTDGTLPGLCKRPGVDSFIFNGSTTAGPALETNTAAQELYYEL